MAECIHTTLPEHQHQPMHKEYTLIDYLHGKVADYTVSENAIEAVCFDRGAKPSTTMEEVDAKTLHLCYADLLRYVYLQPGLTKSYSQTNGTWSQKEGSTQLSDSDKKKILAEMKKQYMLGEEPQSIPATSSSIRMDAHGMVAYRRNRRCL